MARVPIKTAEEIVAMRAASKVTTHILDVVGDLVKPGVSTEEINRFVHKLTIEAGAIPAPLNYKGFPKSVCISINDVVCHGIPSQYLVLKEGDIVNIDVTSIKNGFHSDSSRMYFVGNCSEEAIKLVKTAKDAMYAGIAEVVPGKRIGDIGAAIQAFIKKTGTHYGIVRDYTGHGLGRNFHEPPQVLHVGKFSTGEVMRPGMTFTIEPMINGGTHETVLSELDGWTVRTADGSLSAQWEHTILVTETGCEVLTKAADEVIPCKNC